MKDENKLNNLKAGSNLEKVLASGQFACTGEIGPPKSADFVNIDKFADAMRGTVDAVNFTDNQTGIVRLSSWGAALRLIYKHQMEPTLQIVCRDRNRLAIQSDILGAWAHGVRNVLCLSGDHQAFGNHPGCKAVYDLDAIQLIGVLKKLRDDGCFECGEECKVAPKLFIGCAVNPFADPFEFRVLRMEKKINAGADFMQTQCILDLERFDAFMELVRKEGLHERTHICGGLLPVKSPKMARYVQKGVPGMMVSNDLCERLEKAEKPKDEAVNISVDYIKHCQQTEGVHGVHIMAVAWEEIVPVIVEKAGLMPRPTF